MAEFPVLHSKSRPTAHGARAVIKEVTGSLCRPVSHVTEIAGNGRRRGARGGERAEIELAGRACANSVCDKCCYIHVYCLPATHQEVADVVA